MASVFDVAAYVLQRGSMSTWKLQKLVYYSQAWHLVWDESPLFSEPIEAWANGPVVPELYREHRGQFTIANCERGDPTRLSQSERESIDAVIQYYGARSGHWLSELTHRERPWREARAGLAPGERGSKVITHASLADYYGSLVGTD